MSPYEKPNEPHATARAPARRRPERRAVVGAAASLWLVVLQSGRPTELVRVAILPNDQIDRGFAATVQATEMAVVNALGAAPMTGVNGHRVAALPPDRLRDALRKYGRLTP